MIAETGTNAIYLAEDIPVFGLHVDAFLPRRARGQDRAGVSFACSPLRFKVALVFDGIFARFGLIWSLRRDGSAPETLH